MALSRVKNWASGEVLTHTDLNAEFNNILNNALSLVSPLTGDLAFGGNRATGLSLGSVSSPSVQFTGDANTGVYSTAADTVDIATGGVRAASFGAQALILAAPEDARTATVDVAAVIRSTTSGAPAAGIGVGLQFDAESGDENPSTFGRIDFAATDVGAGTEDTYMDILLRVAGVAEETKYRFASTAATGFQGTFTHAATADRTWTLPDSSVTLLGTAGTFTGTLSGATVSGAAPATPTANILYTDSVVKGWLETSGGGAWTIDDDLNISSITDNGVGDFTINWATAFANANYAIAGNAINNGATLTVEESTGTAKSTTVVRIRVVNAVAAALADPDTGINIIAIGDQ